MAGAPIVLIAGGYGVFGRLLARELLTSTGARVVIAGRDQRRAASLCRRLRAGDRAAPLGLDLVDERAVAAAARGCAIVACAAGPFQSLPARLAGVAAGEGAHWLDIADAPGWLDRLLRDEELDREARGRGVAIIPGLSSVPALAGALARWCADRVDRPARVRVTLRVGNRNRKGAGAIASLLEHALEAAPPEAGRSLRLGGLGAVQLGLPDGVEARFCLSLELPGARLAIAAGRGLASLVGVARASLLVAALAGPTSRFGSAGGSLHAEAADPAGRSARASLFGHGQRLAILPCALAAEALLSGEEASRGVIHPVGWLWRRPWVRALRSRGIQFLGDA